MSIFGPFKKNQSLYKDKQAFNFVGICEGNSGNSKRMLRDKCEKDRILWKLFW